MIIYRQKHPLANGQPCGRPEPVIQTKMKDESRSLSINMVPWSVRQARSLSCHCLLEQGPPGDRLPYGVTP